MPLRRTFLAAAFALAAGAALHGPLAPPPARAVGLDMPLFDTHVHWSANAHDEIPLERALKILDQAGVRMALVSSTSDEATVALYRAAPQRVIPMLRPYRTRSDMGGWHNDPTVPAYLAERLKLGVHKGIGEFHLSGADAGTAVIRDVVKLAVDRGLFMHAHSDAAAVEGLFKHDARVRVLWAHAGFTDPASVSAMLARYPNLYVESAIRGDVGPGGRLGEEWRKSFIAYQDRWMIGTDTYVTSRWHRMPEILDEVRAWLKALPPPVAEKLAWRNAARLFGVPESVFTGAAPARRN